MKILICQNDAVAAAELGRTLRGQGHTVCGTASSAVECIEIVFSALPDLALVDPHLGDGRTGTDLMEALVRLGIPSVIISGERRPDSASVSAGWSLDGASDEDHLTDMLAGIERERQVVSFGDPLTRALACHRHPTRARPRRTASPYGREWRSPRAS